MLGPAVAALGEALDPPAADLLALARRLAATIDAMPPAVAVPMLPNHAGPLVKVLTELDARYRRRSAGREPGAPADGLERLEAAGSAGNGGAPAAGPYWWQGSLKEGLQLGRT